MKTKSLFGMDFLFDEIPHQLEIFDYDAFLASSCEFVTGVTDVITGKPVYFGKEHMNYDSTVLRASSSIPVFSPMVDYKGGKYLEVRDQEYNLTKYFDRWTLVSDLI